MKYIQFLFNNKFKNFFIYGIGQAINLISPLIVMPYLVLVCGKEGLGKVGVGFSFALIIIVLIDYGSYINGTKEISINRNDIDKIRKKIVSIYLMKFYLLVFISIISFFLIRLIPFFYKEQLVFFFSLLFVFGQFLNPTWVFQGTESYKWISFINIFSKIIYVVSVFLFVKQGSDYIFVNAYLGLGLIISSLIGLLFLISKYNLKLYFGATKDAFLLINEEFTLTFSQLFLSFYQYLPIILISYIGGNTMAGQYRIIDQVIMIFRTYLQMFFNFVYADVCLQIHLSLKNGIKQWFKYNSLNYILVFFLLLVSYAFSDVILLHFNIQLKELTTMKLYFKTGLIIPLFMGVSIALKQLLFALNKNSNYIIITIATSFLSLFVLYFLVNKIGLQGAFISTIIIEFLVIVLYCGVLKQLLFLKK